MFVSLVALVMDSGRQVIPAIRDVSDLFGYLGRNTLQFLMIEPQASILHWTLRLQTLCVVGRDREGGSEGIHLPRSTVQQMNKSCDAQAESGKGVGSTSEGRRHRGAVGG
jgi:hypothetical protein